MPHRICRDGLRRLSYLLNGIVTICDWLGSHERFAFEPNETPLDAYQGRALTTATEVVDTLRPAIFQVLPPATPAPFAELFAHLADGGPPPRATWLQQAVDELFTPEQLPDGPLLVLIEDATGSGKTEAGDLVAQRLIALGRAHGLYAALPTTATADAAFVRKKEVVRRFFAPKAHAQVTLAHGRSSSRERLRARYRTRAELEQGDPGCLEWTARSSKRALLADVGVGTIDQALLGALKARHATVRLAGLHGKLLLVDEVHAYDDYMRQPLERLLRHQASVGQNIVLMSATLPSRLRDELVAAFRAGAGWPDDAAPTLPRDRYPALHVVHRGGVIHRGPDRPPEHRPTPVRFEAVRAEEDIFRRIAGWAGGGRCVLWIRNTVDEAVRAFERLRNELGDGSGRVLLYHARFLPADRADAEARLLTALGKASGPADRSGSVVVATQVAEQSLDLDADELVTDLAPIDAILQRLGRRRRHRRRTDGTKIAAGPDRRPESPVLLHMPPLDTVGEGWLDRFSPGSARVYPDHGRLWLGASLLLDPRALPNHPEPFVDPWTDAKPLVEAVYCDEVQAHIPEALHGPTHAAAGAAAAAGQQGERVSLAFAAGLFRDWNEVDARAPDTDEIATTRLGESYEHLLLTDHGNELGFFVSADDPLEVSSVRYWQRIDGLAEDDGRRVGLLTSLPLPLRHRAERQPMLVLAPDGMGGWAAAARIGQRPCQVHYDHLRGLRVARG